MQAYVEVMTSELNNEQNPLDANLEKVLPGLHQWHNINAGQLQKVETAINTLSSSINTGLQTLKEQAEAERLHADQRLAEAFRRLADAYVPNSSPDSNDLVLETMPIPMVTEEEQQQQQGGNEPEPDSGKTMVVKHKCLLDLYCEWYGLGEYTDYYGGIQGREDRFGPKWCRGRVNPQHFSRTKRIIYAIKAYAQEGNMSEQDAVGFLEEDFTMNCSCSLQAFVKLMKEKGLIAERAPRYKKSKEADGSNEDENASSEAS